MSLFPLFSITDECLTLPYKNLPHNRLIFYTFVQVYRVFLFTLTLSPLSPPHTPANPFLFPDVPSSCFGFLGLLLLYWEREARRGS